LGIQDAAFVFVNKNEAPGGKGDAGESLPPGEVQEQEVIELRVAIYGLAHVVAAVAELGQLLAVGGFEDGAVGWAMVNGEGAVVLEKGAVFDGGGSKFGLSVTVEAPGNALGNVVSAGTGSGRNAHDGVIGHQQIRIIGGIQMPADLELPDIVQATGGPGFILRAGEAGQQHGGEDSDDGDYDEQLD
jgi:hypothetical protein